jgi:23S rRNA pseudouridine1911/1915/1917 synthase
MGAAGGLIVNLVPEAVVVGMSRRKSGQKQVAPGDGGEMTNAGPVRGEETLRDSSKGLGEPQDDAVDDDGSDDDAAADGESSAEEGTADLLSGGTLRLTVEPRAHGWRVDHYLARLFPNFSRAQFQKAIEASGVEVNGLPVKMSRRLHVNDIVVVRLPARPDETLQPEPIPLSVLFEDEHLVVINKQAGLITHPGKGNYGGTLANALQYHFNTLSDAAGRFRPGIVHRLDRDTSGVIVVAKNNQVHNHLSSQFEERTVTKEYRAIVWGELEQERGVIVTHMRVHPKHREKMMVCEPGGNAREAVTNYDVVERFQGFTHVRLLPKTGRTHQLRVHMRHLGHPLVADVLYGGRDVMTASYLERGETGGYSGQAAATQLEQARTVEADRLIVRQALHAHRLEFRHPVTREGMVVVAPLPADMEGTLERLRMSRGVGAG